eukprot:COSAG06_NODE_32511_length_504_cov_9.674074_1_plen_26_part_01
MDHAVPRASLAGPGGAPVGKIDRKDT